MCIENILDQQIVHVVRVCFISSVLLALPLFLEFYSRAEVANLESLNAPCPNVGQALLILHLLHRVYYPFNPYSAFLYA